jgi:hypothetical protein
MTKDITGSGGKEFNVETLINSLYDACRWQLGLRGCLNLQECAHEAINEWMAHGRPVAKGHFLFLKDKIIVYIPDAVAPEKVLHSLVCYQARSWKRQCTTCASTTCALVEDFQDDDNPKASSHQTTEPVDPREMLNQKLLVDEILDRIENETHREAFELHLRRGVSRAEIAQHFNVKLNTVNKWFSREIEKLQSIFVPSATPLR